VSHFIRFRITTRFNTSGLFEVGGGFGSQQLPSRAVCNGTSADPFI
jgi:hypothetical protein